MKTDIVFSLIIPYYNNPDMLARLLHSIPQRNDLEVIVVDDKSDVGIKKYAEIMGDNKWIHFLKNDTGKKGAGVCRNIGLDFATGYWVIFADSDDLFENNFEHILDTYKDRDEDILYFYPTSRFYENDSLASRHIEFCDMLDQYVQKRDRLNELRLRFEMVSPWSKFIKRDVLEKNNIRFEDTRVANDVFFCRKLGVYATKIVVIQDTFYSVTEREGSLTTMVDRESFNIRRDVFVRSYEYVHDRISNEDWKLLQPNGRYMLHICRVNHLGICAMLQTIFRCLQGGIRPL